MKPIIICASLLLTYLRLFSQQVEPVRSDEFVDYMGIGATFGNDFGVYDQLVYDGLEELGIRYIRGWMNWLNTGEIGVNEFKDLGVRMCGLWQDPKFKRPLECRPLLKQYGPDFFIAIEGHNEPDIFSKDRCFEGMCNDTRNGIYYGSILHHNTFYEDLKSDPETTHLPIVAPSFARTRQIKNSPRLQHDLRNLHYYPVSGENSNPLAGYGWEGSSWQEVKENLDDYGSNAPVYFTESGNGLHQISELAQAKYIGRMYAEYFREVPGIDKFFYFRLQQQFNTGSGHEAWGLIDTLGNRYDAFYALKSIIHLLGESTYNKSEVKWDLPNAEFVLQPISLSYADKLSTTHDLLLQKGNGRYYLLLWQEINSFLFQSKQDLAPNDDRLTITVAEKIKNVQQYRYDMSTFEYTSEPVQVQDSASIVVNVPDQVTIVAFDLASAVDLVTSADDSSTGLRIYPNPTSGKVHLEGIDVLPNELYVVDITGKLRKIKPKNSTLDMSAFPNGTYYLKIPVGADKVLSKTIIVLKENQK